MDYGPHNAGGGVWPDDSGAWRDIEIGMKYLQVIALISIADAKLEEVEDDVERRRGVVAGRLSCINHVLGKLQNTATWLLEVKLDQQPAAAGYTTDSASESSSSDFSPRM